MAWAAGENLNLFGTVSRGFRPGGFNTLAAAPEVQFEPRFDSETLTNYELGLRFRSADSRWSVNAALFYIDYDDQQFFLFDPLGSQVLINANESEIYGGELEVAWRVSDYWTLMGAYGYTDSEIESIDAKPGLTVPPEEIVGNRLPNAPKDSLNLVAQWVRPVADDYEWSARIEYERRGKTTFTIDGLNTQEAYDIVNLRGGVGSGPWHIAWPSPERLAGVEFTWQF